MCSACSIDASESLALLDVAREFPDNVRIWYLEGERPARDIHYKIVDAANKYIYRDMTVAVLSGSTS